MSAENKKQRTHFRGSLFFPVFLIFIGVVFLLNNLGALSLSARDTILLCWPLLFVVGGLDSLLRREGAAIPTFFVGLGVILMLSNFDQLAVSTWQVLWSIWPIFLVAVGFDIMFGRRAFWTGLLASILIIAILLGVVWYFGSNLVRERLTTDIIEQTLSDVESAEVTLQPIVGHLSLSDQSQSDTLIVGKVKRLPGEKLLSSYQDLDNVGIFDIRSAGGTFLFSGTSDSQPSWDFRLTTDIPIDLNVNMIVGKLVLEAQELNLSNLLTSLVVGETVVYLPEEGNLSAKVEGVIGKTILYVPDSMAVSINARAGFLNVWVPEDYVSRDDRYYSPNYFSAANHLDLEVSQVIGQVSIEKK